MRKFINRYQLVIKENKVTINFVSFTVIDLEFIYEKCNVCVILNDIVNKVTNSFPYYIVCSNTTDIIQVCPVTEQTLAKNNNILELNKNNNNCNNISNNNSKNESFKVVITIPKTDLDYKKYNIKGCKTKAISKFKVNK